MDLSSQIQDARSKGQMSSLSSFASNLNDLPATNFMLIMKILPETKEDAILDKETSAGASGILRTEPPETIVIPDEDKR